MPLYTSFTQFPECTSTDCKKNGIKKKFARKLLVLPMVENNELIPNHQFGFRQRHSTIE
jgi:hypothetical protein